MTLHLPEDPQKRSDQAHLDMFVEKHVAELRRRWDSLSIAQTDELVGSMKAVRIAWKGKAGANQILQRQLWRDPPARTSSARRERRGA